MNKIVELPNGVKVGTGLQIPLKRSTSFAVYEDVGPMVSMDDIIAAAKSKQFSGRAKFDKSWLKNQRSHGSCNGFAEAGALSKSRVRRFLPRVDLSGAYAYSLINGGSDNGSQLESGMRKACEVGIATAATVPWDAIYRNRYDVKKADAEAENFKAFECYGVNTEIGLFSALVSGFDCVVAVDVDDNGAFMHLDSHGISGGGSGPGNHAVQIDGCVYEDDTLKADMENTWGETFGADGRTYLTWKRHFVQTSRYHYFYAMRSTIDGKRITDPPIAVTS